MASIEIERGGEDKKILRFLSRDGIMNTLGFQNGERMGMAPTLSKTRMDIAPTFLLRSLKYYQRLEDSRGNSNENEIISVNPEKKTSLSNKDVNPFLVSCWSCYSTSDLSNIDVWKAFPNAVGVIELQLGMLKT